jgi:type I restriction enzyme S subunit
MTVLLARVGDLLQQTRRTAPVSTTKTYPMVGARNFARGSFDAGSLRGTDTKYRELQLVKAGDLIYPKLGAWEGAFAFVDPDLGDRYTSPEYCVFTICSAEADAAYLRHLFAWEPFWRSLAARSTGTNVRRRRLQPGAFLDGRLPLPDLLDQRRIAARLDGISATSASFGTPPTAALRDSLLDRVSQRSRIGDIATLARHPVSVRADAAYPNLGIFNRARGVFAKPPMRGSETKYSTLYLVRAGQLIYSKLFGWEGSLGIVPEWADGWFVSSEFPTYDVKAEVVDLDYFRQVLRWRGLSEQLAAATSGMGQRRQRVQIEQFEALEVPLPDLSAQHKIGADLLRLAEVEGLSARRATLSAALLPAARNEAFARLT